MTLVRSIFPFLLTFWGVYDTAIAAEFRWDGGCEGVLNWNQKCAGLDTNWDQPANTLPGASDSVVLTNTDPLTTLGQHFTIKTANIDSSLDIQSYFLTLSEGGDFNQLQMASGGLAVNTGSLINLTGQSTLGGTFRGGGSIFIFGPWSGRISAEQGAYLESYDTGTWNLTGTLNGENTEVGNLGTIELSATIMGGETSLVSNGGTFRALGGGAIEIQPGFYSSGQLEVAGEGTYLWMKSRRCRFDGGSVSVGNGATLKLDALNGGVQIHEILKEITFSGQGLVDVYEDYQVWAPVVFDLGTGDAVTGSGGLRLNTILFVAPDKDVTNESRFRFNNGSIVGGGNFVNRGEAFTNDVGSGTLAIDVENRGTFSALCCPVLISGEKTFSNFEKLVIEKSVEIKSGSVLRNIGQAAGGQGRVIMNQTAAEIRGAGEFVNYAGQLIVDVGANGVAKISVQGFFNNPVSDGGNALVLVKTGRLNITSPFLTNLTEDGHLVGGTWVALDGIIDFPGTITSVGNTSVWAFAGRTRVGFRTPQPDFMTLDFIHSSGVAQFDGGQTFSQSVVVKGVLGGNGLRVHGKVTALPGGQILVPPGGIIEIDEDLDLGSVLFGGNEIPELSSEIEPIEDPSQSTPTPPVQEFNAGNGNGLSSTLIKAAKLNNYGRVLPGGRGRIDRLNFEGAYEQYSKGRLQVETSSDGTSDELRVVGDAVLDGMLELARLAGDNPLSNHWYTVFSTTGTMTGTFDRVSSVDDYELRYNAQSVEVRFTRVTAGVIFWDGYE